MAGYGRFTNLIQKLVIFSQFSNLLLQRTIIFLKSAETYRDAVDDAMAEFQRDAINNAQFRCFVNDDRKWAWMCHVATLMVGFAH